MSVMFSALCKESQQGFQEQTANLFSSRIVIKTLGNVAELNSIWGRQGEVKISFKKAAFSCPF
jgi:hypothetical protein